MLNPKTTVLGYIIIAGAVAKLILDLLHGAPVESDIGAIVAALAGAGLVVAKDGGH